MKKLKIQLSALLLMLTISSIPFNAFANVEEINNFVNSHNIQMVRIVNEEANVLEVVTDAVLLGLCPNIDPVKYKIGSKIKIQLFGDTCAPVDAPVATDEVLLG